MSSRRPARSVARRRRFAVVVGVAVVGAALVGLVLDRSSATAGNDVRAMPTVAAGTPSPPPPAAMSGSLAPGPSDRLPRDEQDGLGEDDGVVPDGVTVFDGGYSAVARLDPALLRALRQAARDAARNSTTFYVDTGWRSPKYQERLLLRAIAKYGSEEVAARWVAVPEKSAHVSGDAIDIGHADAAAWLSRHGATYGLCQIYRNEPWHYELRPEAVSRGCPRMYADPTQDPRMRP